MLLFPWSLHNSSSLALLCANFLLSEKVLWFFFLWTPFFLQNVCPCACVLNFFWCDLANSMIKKKCFSFLACLEVCSCLCGICVCAFALLLKTALWKFDEQLLFLNHFFPFKKKHFNAPNFQTEYGFLCGAFCLWLFFFCYFLDFISPFGWCDGFWTFFVNICFICLFYLTELLKVSQLPEM